MLIVVCGVLAAHAPGLHAGALCFDDSEYLTDNPLVRHPSFASAWRFLHEVLEPSTVHGYYQPLTMISLMIDSALGGRPDDLLAFHRTSLLLHLLNTLMIVLLLYRLFGDAWAAGVAGLLFGVHPMTVETIVWVGERKTVLATCFVLLTLLSYVRFARATTVPAAGTASAPGATRTQSFAFAAALGCFALALMSKPTVTTLPACLILLDFWPLRRLNRRALLEKLPFFALAAVSAVITFESQRRTAVAVLPGQAGSISAFYVTAHNIVFYLHKMLWPTYLSSHYPFPVPLNLSNPTVTAGVIGTLALLALLAVSLRWTRAPATGWLFFFVAIFPTLGVIGFTNVIAADKYAYWPALGLLLAIAWLAATVRRRKAFPPWLRTGLPLGVTALAALALAVTTRGYLQHWSTTESLSRYMVATAGEAAAAPLIHLALELDRQERSAEAVDCYQRAALAAPAYEGTFYNLGNALRKLGREDDAIAAYARAIAIKPDFADAYTNLGNALLAKGDTAGAVRAYTRSIELAPRRADAHYNLANLRLRENDTAGAIAHYTRAIELQPTHAAAHKNLAGVMLQQGRLPEAIQHFEQAVQLQPKYWDVAVYLADVYADAADPALRQPQRAVQLAQHAVKITQRRHIGALAALANASGRTGDLPQAAAAAREAVALAQAAGQPDLLAKLRTRLGLWLPAGASQ